MAALTALNWKIAGLAALNRKNSVVKWQKTEKTAALMACNRKNSGVNSVELEGWQR